ncbi:MAG TPA: hypothetical protein VFQ44_06010 [Streptosporangiaceae bacterium]|nr:hypothetical protein [Streptosporangiaceae bacterium]
MRSSGLVLALVLCFFAGARLMSFAAGDPGHAAAIGDASRAHLGAAAGDGHHGASAGASKGAASSGAHRGQEGASTPAPSASPAPPALASVSGRSVTAVGDSVMVAATPALDQALPGIYIDAAVGRQFSTGLSVIAGLKAQGLLRPIVVVGLGTNGTVTSKEISQLFAEIGPDRRLVLVNTFEDRSWEQEVNSALAAAAAAHPSSVMLADWFRTIEHRTDLLWPDGIHPQPAGGVVYAKMLKLALEKVAALPG